MEIGKRTEAPTSTEKLAKQVGAGETPQKEPSLVSNTGSSKKLDKKQVQPSKKATGASKKAEQTADEKTEKSRKRDSKATDKKE